MGVFEMVVAIVLITSIAGVIEKKIKAERSGQGALNATVQAELQQVRAEMAELRRSTTEVVLSFESTLQRLDARVGSLEQHAIGAGSAPSAITSGLSGGLATPAAPQDVRVSALR